MGIRQVHIDINRTREGLEGGISLTREAKGPLDVVRELVQTIVNATEHTPIQEIPSNLEEVLVYARHARARCIDASTAVEDGFADYRERFNRDHPVQAEVKGHLQSAQKKLNEGGADGEPGVKALALGIRDDFADIQGHLQAIREKLGGPDGTQAKVQALGSLIMSIGGQTWLPRVADSIFGRDNPHGDLPAACDAVVDYQKRLLDI